jgi:hypothetical protein
MSDLGEGFASGFKDQFVFNLENKFTFLHRDVDFRGSHVRDHFLIALGRVVE